MALLIEAYQQWKQGEVDKDDAVATLSKRLRGRMLRLGTTISDTYRNENGINLQLSAIDYCFTDGIWGLGKPSKLFREMVALYKTDREAFQPNLYVAEMMYPVVVEERASERSSDTGEKAHSNEGAKGSAGVSPATTAVETPELPNKASVAAEDVRDDSRKEKILQVLKEKFPRGYRLGSFMEARRLQTFYEAIHGEALALSQEELDGEVRDCGIEHEGRVYLPELMLSEELCNELLDYVRQLFADGTQCIYYSVLFDTFHERFLDYRILNPSMLRRYLEAINTDGWRFWTGYMTEKQYAEIDIQKAVEEYVKAQGGIVSKEEAVKGLPLLPPQEVETAFDADTTTLISCGRNTRFHIDSFVATEQEMETAVSIIEKTIKNYRYITFRELLEELQISARGILENNDALPEIGKRNALKVKLSNRFKFTNNIISSYDESFSTEDAFRELAKHKTFTKEDVRALAADCGSLPNHYIGFLLENNVRVDGNRYVSAEMVHFDVAAIDEALEIICPSAYIPLNNDIIFTVLPNCGYPWNLFLLESYLAYHSKAFCLVHNRYFGQEGVSGAMVNKKFCLEKGIGILDFDAVLALALTGMVTEKIELNQDNALEYLCRKGLISSRRYDKIGDILNAAKQIIAKVTENKV